jgi:uncharacterized protein
MADQSVTVARIFLREGEHLLDKIIDCLHNEQKVSGVTVLQGIAGFSNDGVIRTSRLVDLSLDLPLVIEFYDLPERVEQTIDVLHSRLGLTHIISWPAKAHIVQAETFIESIS